MALRRAYDARGNRDEAARLERLADSLSGGEDEHSLMRLARLVVLRRAVDTAPAPAEWPAGAEPIELATRRVDVSSTEVRSR